MWQGIQASFKSEVTHLRTYPDWPHHVIDNSYDASLDKDTLQRIHDGQIS